MNYEEAIQYQKEQFNEGCYISIHQEHDDIGSWYDIPTTRVKAEEEMQSREWKKRGDI